MTRGQYLIDRIGATSNVDVRGRAEVAAVRGNGHLEQVVLRHLDSAEEQSVTAAALFIFIGAAPRSDLVAGAVELDDQGFILTGPDLPRTVRGISGWQLDRDPLLFETSIPGVFAAGDVRARANRRVAGAVGEGSAAVHSVHRYLETV
jgi:thioredoxin reductase (NADPH)